MLGLQRYSRVVAALVEAVWDAGAGAVQAAGVSVRCRLCRRRARAGYFFNVVMQRIVSAAAF